MLDPSLSTIIGTVVNLLILCVAFKFVLFKPVNDILEKRQAQADEQFGEAKRLQDEATELKTKYEESMTGIEQERKNTISLAKKEADAQYQKIVDDANNEAKEIKKKATFDAQTQKAQIIKSAEKEIADMVVDAATKVTAGAKVDASIYDEFLGKAGE